MTLSEVGIVIYMCENKNELKTNAIKHSVRMTKLNHKK